MIVNEYHHRLAPSAHSASPNAHAHYDGSLEWVEFRGRSLRAQSNRPRAAQEAQDPDMDVRNIILPAGLSSMPHFRDLC